MGWHCRLIDIVGTKHLKYDPPRANGICGETVFVDSEGKELRFREMMVGSMFYVPKDADMDSWPWYNADKEAIADYYYQHNTHRQPLFVILPDHTLFLLDGKCWKDGVKYGGWQVSGEAPNITVQPSININGFYHGFLQNGIISDDVEGRKFNWG